MKPYTISDFNKASKHLKLSLKKMVEAMERLKPITEEDLERQDHNAFLNKVDDFRGD